jgi:ABC-type polysaccharide/polyol phosphate export permease
VIGALDVRWALADSATLTRRYLAHLRHQPAQLVASLGFPVLILLIFVYLMGGMMVVPGDDYAQLLVPGMLTMTVLSGLGATMLAVVTDLQRGITDRFRSMPMAPSAVLVGRAVADLVISALELVVLMLAGLAVGWRIEAGPAGVLAAVRLLLLLRFALLWVGIYVGLLARSGGAVTAAQTLEFPVAFLSGVFLAPAAMPAVIGSIAEWNPLSSTAAAARALFGNPGWGGDSWIAQHPLLMAVVWPLVIIAVFGPLSVHRFKELSR